MKISALANPRIQSSEPSIVNKFLECDQQECAWYCTYSNGKGECAIHALPGLFDELNCVATRIANGVR